MPVNYSISKVKNREKNTFLYYAKAQLKGTVGLRELADSIAMRTTLSRADTMAVIVALGELVPEILSDGKQVELGGLGTLWVRLSSNCTATSQEFTAQNIYGCRVYLKPGDDIDGVKMIRDMKFRFVPKRKNQTTALSADREELDLTLSNANEA